MTELGSPAERDVLSDLAHKLVDQVALYGLAKGVAKAPAVAAAIQRAKDERAQLLQDINAKIFLRDIAPTSKGPSSEPHTKHFCVSKRSLARTTRLRFRKLSAEKIISGKGLPGLQATSGSLRTRETIFRRS